MAFSVGTPNGGRNGRNRFRGGSTAISEINVVPLVDVVLVLLIIFMMTAHVMEFGLEVDVPKVREVRETTEDLPVITMGKTGEVYLADKPVNINVLGDEIKRRYPRATGVFLRADKGTVWDPMASVIAMLGQAKLQVRLVTQPLEDRR
jgi:biopolymer transport protein ExbD